MLCEDPAVIGTPFYVMAMVDGRIFGSPDLPGLSRDVRAQHFDAMNRWAGQYHQDMDAGALAGMDELIEWQRANQPAAQEPRLIHGDLRGHNFIFAPEGPEVLAIRDWELSTIGDPLADFTYHLMMYRLPRAILGGLAGTQLDTLGIPFETTYTAAYCRRTGREGVAALAFYLAFNMFRFAAILHGVKGRLVRGNAASENARSLVETLPMLVEIALAQTKEP